MELFAEIVNGSGNGSEMVQETAWNSQKVLKSLFKTFYMIFSGS